MEQRDDRLVLTSLAPPSGQQSKVRRHRALQNCFVSTSRYEPTHCLAWSGTGCTESPGSSNIGNATEHFRHRHTTDPSNWVRWNHCTRKVTPAPSLDKRQVVPASDHLGAVTTARGFLGVPQHRISRTPQSYRIPHSLPLPMTGRRDPRMHTAEVHLIHVDSLWGIPQT